jgi:hypothetical protein
MRQLIMVAFAFYVRNKYVFVKPTSGGEAISQKNAGRFQTTANKSLLKSLTTFIL